MSMFIVRSLVGVTMYVNQDTCIDRCVSLTNLPTANPRILLWPVVSEASGLKGLTWFAVAFFPFPIISYLAPACAF
jgi:hypothetical protein